nr:MAG: capsid protein [Tuatara cloaca-associated totivirus-1]
MIYTSMSASPLFNDLALIGPNIVAPIVTSTNTLFMRPRSHGRNLFTRTRELSDVVQFQLRNIRDYFEPVTPGSKKLKLNSKGSELALTKSLTIASSDVAKWMTHIAGDKIKKIAAAAMKMKNEIEKRNLTDKCAKDLLEIIANSLLPGGVTINQLDPKGLNPTIMEFTCYDTIQSLLPFYASSCDYSLNGTQRATLFDLMNLLILDITNEDSVIDSDYTYNYVDSIVSRIPSADPAAGDTTTVAEARRTLANAIKFEEKIRQTFEKEDPETMEEMLLHAYGATLRARRALGAAEAAVADSITSAFASHTVSAPGKDLIAAIVNARTSASHDAPTVNDIQHLGSKDLFYKFGGQDIRFDYRAVMQILGLMYGAFGFGVDIHKEFIAPYETPEVVTVTSITYTGATPNANVYCGSPKTAGEVGLLALILSYFDATLALDNSTIFNQLAGTNAPTQNPAASIPGDSQSMIQAIVYLANHILATVAAYGLEGEYLAAFTTGQYNSITLVGHIEEGALWRDIFRAVSYPHPTGILSDKVSSFGGVIPLSYRRQMASHTTRRMMIAFLVVLERAIVLHTVPGKHWSTLAKRKHRRISDYAGLEDWINVVLTEWCNIYPSYMTGSSSSVSFAPMANAISVVAASPNRHLCYNSVAPTSFINVAPYAPSSDWVYCSGITCSNKTVTLPLMAGYELTDPTRAQTSLFAAKYTGLPARAQPLFYFLADQAKYVGQDRGVKNPDGLAKFGYVSTGNTPHNRATHAGSILPHTRLIDPTFQKYLGYRKLIGLSLRACRWLKPLCGSPLGLEAQPLGTNPDLVLIPLSDEGWHWDDLASTEIEFRWEQTRVAFGNRDAHLLEDLPVHGDPTAYFRSEMDRPVNADVEDEIVISSALKSLVQTDLPLTTASTKLHERGTPGIQPVYNTPLAKPVSGSKTNTNIAMANPTADGKVDIDPVTGQAPNSENRVKLSSELPTPKSAHAHSAPEPRNTDNLPKIGELSKLVDEERQIRTTAREEGGFDDGKENTSEGSGANDPEPGSQVNGPLSA